MLHISRDDPAKPMKKINKVIHCVLVCLLCHMPQDNIIKEVTKKFTGSGFDELWRQGPLAGVKGKGVGALSAVTMSSWKYLWNIWTKW